MGLRLRRRLPALFTSGTYEPLSAAGAHADRLVAFARTESEQAVIVVAPRATVGLCGFGGSPPVGDVWGETELVLPESSAARNWCDVFTGRNHRANGEGGGIPIAGLLAQLPFALLVASPA